MKRIALDERPLDIADLCKTAQGDSVLLTRGGVPYAMIVGLENKDGEDLELQTSRAFWRMIRERRQEKGGVRLEEFMTKLEARERAAKKGKTKKPAGRRAARP